MEKITRILGVTASLVVMLSLTGCYYNDVLEAVIPVNTDVSFANDIQPIFNANCVSCHPSIVDPDLTEGNSYNSLISIPGGIVPGNATGSELVDMLEHDPNNPNPMPPSGPIASSQISLVKQWIDQGALNN